MEPWKKSKTPVRSFIRVIFENFHNSLGLISADLGYWWFAAPLGGLAQYHQ